MITYLNGVYFKKKLKLTSKNKNTMSKSQIREFIMFYERITRQMMIDFKYILI